MKNKKVLNIIGALIIVIIVIGTYNIFQMTNKKELKEWPVEEKLVINTWLLVGIISIIGLVGLTLLLMKKYSHWEIHKKFFVVCLILGSLYFILTPVFGGHDEIINLKRVYEITNGDFITPIKDGVLGSELPESIKTLYYNTVNDTYFDVGSHMQIPLSKDETSMQTDYGNASLYAPIQYLPNIIGMVIGKILNLPIYFIILLGRFCSFLFYLVIITLSIKVIPERKTLVMLLSLMPIMLVTAVQVSGDTVTTGMVIFFCCYLYKLIKEKKQIHMKDVAILVCASIVIALCKIVYLPLVFLLLLFPKECFKSKKKYYITILIIILIACIIGVAWYLIASDMLGQNYKAADKQKTFVLTHPFKYISAIANSILEYGGEYVIEYATGGNKGCQMPVPAYNTVSVLFLVILVVNLFMEETKLQLQIKQKAIIGIVALMLVVLIYTAIYIQWTSRVAGVGNETVVGVQGKYFIPVSVLALFIIEKKKVNISSEKIINIYLVLHLPILLQIFTNNLI